MVGSGQMVQQSASSHQTQPAPKHDPMKLCALRNRTLHTLQLSVFCLFVMHNAMRHVVRYVIMSKNKTQSLVPTKKHITGAHNCSITTHVVFFGLIWVPMFLGTGADCRQYSLSDFLIMHQASQYSTSFSLSTLAPLCLSLTDQFALRGINKIFSRQLFHI